MIAPALQSAAALFGGRPARTPELSLYDFIRQAWHVPEPATPFIDGWHVQAIAEHLEAVSRGQIRDLVINMPPRFAKSLLVAVFWPAWEWHFAPSMRWLFATYAQNLTLRDSVRCRRLIESPWYQSRWKGAFRLVGDQNTKTKFENDQTGFRLATSVGGQATGEGGDRIVVDDPHNVRQALSDVSRESAVDWYFQTMSTRGNNPQTRARVVVMQRLHEKDLSGEILERGEFEHLCLPMRFEPARRCLTAIGWQDPREAAGELLCPARFDDAATRSLERELGSYGASGQLQQNPAPAAGGIVKKEWWKRTDVLPPVWDEQVISWDMAFKGEVDEADYVVGTAWARLGADCYLLDLVCAQLEFPESQKGTIALAKAWPAIHAKLVEDKANGPAIISSLRRVLPGLIAYEPPGALEGRVRAIAPVIESGNVYLPGPRRERERFEYWKALASKPGSWLPLHHVHPDWVDRWIHQWAVFPKGANDDQVASGCQALERLVRNATQVAQTRKLQAAQLATDVSEAAAVSSRRF